MLQLRWHRGDSARTRDHASAGDALADGARTQQKPTGRCQKRAGGYWAGRECFPGGCPPEISHHSHQHPTEGGISPVLAGQTCQPRSCPRDHGLKLFSTTFPIVAVVIPHLPGGAFPGAATGDRQQRGRPSRSFRPSTWFRSPIPARPIPGLRVRPVCEVLAGTRKPSLSAH